MADTPYEMNWTALKTKLANPKLRTMNFVLLGLLVVAGAGYGGLRYGQRSVTKVHPPQDVKEVQSNHQSDQAGHDSLDGSAHHQKSGEDYGKLHGDAGKAAHGDSQTRDLASATAEAKKEPQSLDPAATSVKSAGKTGILATYIQAYRGIQERARALREADVENSRLKLENTNLRLKLESMQFSCHASDAAKETKTFEMKLDRETGTKMGRTLASISYQLPTHLMPQQLFTLGTTYFKAREDEKAAVIFTFLTGQEDDDHFKTAKNYLMTGVAWYRLDNLNVADSYFDRALKAVDIAELPTVQAQARVWKALVAQKLGNRRVSQRLLRDVLNLNPHSMEAKWVNSREVKRAVASQHDDSER